MKIDEIFGSNLLEGQDWSNLNKLAKSKFGKTGFSSLSEEDMDSLIDLNAANKIAEKQHGEFGFATCDQTAQQSIIDKNPSLIRKG